MLVDVSDALLRFRDRFEHLLYSDILPYDLSRSFYVSRRGQVTMLGQLKTFTLCGNILFRRGLNTEMRLIYLSIVHRDFIYLSTIVFANRLFKFRIVVQDRFFP
jgi:hypothetical protein